MHNHHYIGISWTTLVLLSASTILVFAAAEAYAQTNRSARKESVPTPILLRIVKAEDERRWDSDLRDLFRNQSGAIRKRAVLAAGRIGSEDSVSPIVDLLTKDGDVNVRAMAAFALGEIESNAGADALLAVLKDNRQSEDVRARVVEALGKIAAELPKEKETRQRELGAAILEALKFENEKRSDPDEQTILLGLTAVLRSRPPEAGSAVASFLSDSSPRIRADAANTLARLRAKEGNEKLRTLLTADPDPIVRANAARVLGATEDKLALEGLLGRASEDADLRVRVSAVRALASLKDPVAKEVLFKRVSLLTKLYRSARTTRPNAYPAEKNELLEIGTALSRLNSPTDRDFAWLKEFRDAEGATDPEIEIALARMSPNTYMATLGTGPTGKLNVQKSILLNWRSGSSIAQGLGQIAALPESAKSTFTADAEELLRALLNYRNSGLHINTLVAVHSEYAIPDVLRALVAFKPKDLAEVLRAQLNESDVIVRATAAELLGDLPPSDENATALMAAWPRTASDRLNDAALSILDSLAKQKKTATNEFIQKALESKDYLVRQKAVALLRENGIGDFSQRIGIVQTRNTMSDYRRALSRIGKSLFATVTTSKGSFTMELLPDEAPLTVDNFARLAQSGYFRNVTIHRVVPNFVIQDGDPRGDGNGGPGYQIRCEINEVPYDRAAVGMALSGKDTGGSQWFVTHSPQPHLDGGYTVFGRVIKGMEVVDNIVRGDTIQAIKISSEKNRESERE